LNFGRRRVEQAPCFVDSAGETVGLAAGRHGRDHWEHGKVLPPVPLELSREHWASEFFEAISRAYRDRPELRPYVAERLPLGHVVRKVEALNCDFKAQVFTNRDAAYRRRKVPVGPAEAHRRRQPWRAWSPSAQEFERAFPNVIRDEAEVPSRHLRAFAADSRPVGHLRKRSPCG
jgi:hypothetical protein